MGSVGVGQVLTMTVLCRYIDKSFPNAPIFPFLLSFNCLLVDKNKNEVAEIPGAEKSNSNTAHW